MANRGHTSPANTGGVQSTYNDIPVGIEDLRGGGGGGGTFFRCDDLCLGKLL